jgi:hypothetical protein
MTPSVAALLLLAGCGDGTTAQQNVTKVKVAVPGSDRLAALPPLDRSDGLWRALRDAGQRCKRVDAGAFQQDYKDMAMWTAHCTDSGQWMVFIAPNDDIQIRRCADAATLQLPACKPLPPSAALPAVESKATTTKG